MAVANQYSGATSAKAQQEIKIMCALKDRPQTPTEICEAIGLPNKRVRYLLQGLKQAQCIGKIPGSHAVRLLAIC